MLVLPMTTPSSSKAHQRATSPYTTQTPREESPQTSELRKQVASTMLSVITPSQLSPPKRPKLSLQTSVGPSRPPSVGRASFIPEGTESPTARNTRLNTFEAQPPTPSSAISPPVSFPSVDPTFNTPLPAASSQGHLSPFTKEEPYVLPLGTHSILLNSPLPKRMLSASSIRASKRLFPPRKEVRFSERPVEVAPTPFLEVLDDEESDISRTEEQREDRRRVIQQEDGHSTAGQRRTKKRREWIWRPMDDDVLLEHGLSKEDSRTE